MGPKLRGIFSIFRRLNRLSCFGKAFSKKIKRLVDAPLGVSVILIIFFIPLIMYGVHYLIEYSKTSEVETNDFEVAHVIGKNLAKLFNPGKTWSEQEEYLYSKAAQIYNDSSFPAEKKMSLDHEKTIKVGVKSESKSVTNLCDFYTNYSTHGRLDNLKFSSDRSMLVNCQPFAEVIYDENKQKLSYLRSNTGITDDIVYTENKYQQDKSKLELSLNNGGDIIVKCKELNKQSTVTLARNDVDIIIAIPTNRASNTTTNDKDGDFGDYTNAITANATPIRQIARACQLFLQPFLHTAGVAVGIIPYSGKVSISPYRDSNIVTETLMNSNPEGGLAYAVQAMFYGSDGKLGGDVILHNETDPFLAYGDYLDWGSDSYGRPIMARRGQLALYRGMYLNSGSITDRTGSESLLLDMITSPSTSEDNYKFMTMNANPCYLGFCNTLAMTCEKNCPTYQANPYFMTELTSDIQELILDLELFVPFKDERNKSNFLFLPIVMAGNLFSWGEHPSELSSTGRVPEASRANKKRIVVIIANAPDNFEPQEITYLGFNNDYSEIPMIESDTILFNRDRGYVYQDGKYTGVKGAVQFSSSDGTLGNEGYLFKATSPGQEMRARVSFPNKGLLKIVAKRENPATVTVYDDNGVEDNVGTRTFLVSKTLTFRGPQQVKDWGHLETKFSSGNYTTKGPNFGHNTSTKKVKIKFSGCKLNNATLSNQILRFYGTYARENGKSQIGPKMDPCVDFGSKGNPEWGDCTSYIRAYDFNPICHGVSNLDKFVMAASCLSDGIIDDMVKINSVSTGSGVKSATDARYRVYPGGRWGSSAVQVSTGKLQIKNNAYYDLYVSKKQRSRTVTHRITTKRTFPDRANTATQGTSSNMATSYNNSACCSIVWQGMYVPYEKVTDVQCNGIYVYKLGSETCQQKSVGSNCNNITCPSVTYSARESIRDVFDMKSNAVTGDKFRYLKEKEITSVTYTKSGTCRIKECDCHYKDVEPCKQYEIYKDYFMHSASGGSCCPGDTTTQDGQCNHYVSTVNGQGMYVPHQKTGGQCCAGDEKVDGQCKHSYVSRKECIAWTKKWVCSSCIYCCNNQLVRTWIDGGSNCERLKYHWVYNQDGYKDTADCTGVCYNSVVTDKEGWTRRSNESRSCNYSVPSTTLVETFTREQSQTTESCTYSKNSGGSDVNSICTYPSISIPSVSYSYSNCGDSVSGSSYDNLSSSNWNERILEHRRFYTRYLKNIDGESKGTECFICNDSGSGCVSASCSADSPSNVDNGKTLTTPYRYKLYNFFFVNGDTKSMNYAYSGSYPDYTLTSAISSDSDSNLIRNQGIYLLSTGEDNTYWVCFCGDANLTLNFTDATEAGITFSNINPIKYQISLGDRATETSGVMRNDIDTMKIFYIHPDQIKDNLDENGNYYVDLKLNGQLRILSIELTNRPLKTEILSGSNNGVIVNADSRGRKVVGNTDTVIELKLPRKADYTFSAQPISFWIDGPRDFQQDSGTVRICSNTNETNGIIRAKVPDEGAGKIILTAEQPARNYTQSDTGVLINEVTPNYNYRISTDRKLQSIKVPSFVAPKAIFNTGATGTKAYIFCAKEIIGDSASRLFDWPLTSFSHAAVNNGSGFSNKICYGIANTVDFNLTACKITKASAENLIMQFSPTVNDFPSVTFSNTYGNTILQGLAECQDELNFVDDNNYSNLCGYLDDGGFDCRPGYWLPWSSCADGGYYAQHDSNMISWQTETKIDMTEAFNQYGQGTILLYAYRGARPLNVEFFAGASNVFYDKGINTEASLMLTGVCTSSTYANAKMSEVIVDSTHTGLNYLDACYYQVTDPCDLTGSDHLSYSNKDEMHHNYEGKLSFHGIGDVRVYVQPQKVMAERYYEREMSESELSGSFGNYKYTFSEQDYLLNIDDQELTRGNASFELLYSTGTVGTSTVEAGGYVDYSVRATELINDYYYTDINVKNVLITILSSVVSRVDDNVFDVSQSESLAPKTITISPHTHTYEEKGDGYYYVKITCRNVCISDLHAVSNLLVYYGHPNIIDDNLKNTRIIDGYDQALYQRMNLYGNMNLHNDTLPAVSAVQKLFYNIKTNDNAKYFFPRISGANAALSEEEGDFFIQIWDHNSEVPAVQWKINDAIQSSIGDVTAIGAGFGPFKSNYAFNGLHRMFFPYDTYNKDYAGYSRAYNSALVFAGYTLPINYILVNNGYQHTYSLSSGQVSNYTRPNTALSNLAKDACAKLKTDLSNNEGTPEIFLVKYRVDSTLSLESCADYSYSANDEEKLLKIMRQISLDIEESTRTNELRINVSSI